MINVTQWQDRGAWIDFRGHRIFFQEAGEGPPLLLIHGFPTCSWDWRCLWPGLTQAYHCLAPDMLGFGFSDKPRKHAYSLFEQTDLCEELLLQRGLGEAHVLAHDYGDTVLQELLARQREGKNRISILSAYMLNGGIIPGQHRPRAMQRLLLSPLGRFIGPMLTEQRFKKSFAEIFGKHSQPTLEELQGWWGLLNHKDGLSVTHRLIRYMHERRRNHDRWVTVLANSPAPLRFLAGAEDPISGKHMAECFGRLGQQQDWGVLADVGHYPQTESPEAVLEGYRAFRQRVAT